MRIGIDIDDTLNLLAPTLNEACIEYNRRNNIVFDVKDDEWEFEDAYGWNEDNIKEFMEKEFIELLMEANTQPNAAEVIKKLKSEGNEIIIITARGKNSCWNPYEDCKTWLDKHNILYDKIIVKCENKGIACKEEKIDVFIDDNVDYCLTVNRNKTKIFLFDSKFNKKDKIFDRVYNWNEVYEKITKMKI